MNQFKAIKSVRLLVKRAKRKIDPGRARLGEKMDQLVLYTSMLSEIVPANLFFGDFVSLISLSRWQFESDSVSNQQEIKF